MIQSRKMNILTILFSIFPFLSCECKKINWIVEQLRKIPKGENILDVGAGECRYKKYCKHLHYLSQDLSRYNGKGDNKGLQTSHWDVSQIDIISDIISLPLKKESLDNILCSEVLEHLPYPDMAIKELSRVLKKNGKLIITAPFSSLTHFSPFHYCTGFNIYWYKVVFEKYNLRIVKAEPNGNYFDYVCQEIARVPFVTKKYSPLSYVSFISYLLLIPTILSICFLSKITKKSEELLCFGYHVIAVKI